jgi:hypothetical protein
MPRKKARALRAFFMPRVERRFASVRTGGDRNGGARRPFYPDLFDLRFLVDNVLARNRIVLLDLDLIRCGTFVFRGGIEVTGSGARLELDFFPHLTSP